MAHRRGTLSTTALQESNIREPVSIGHWSMASDCAVTETESAFGSPRGTVSRRLGAFVKRLERQAAGGMSKLRSFRARIHHSPDSCRQLVALLHVLYVHGKLNQTRNPDLCTPGLACGEGPTCTNCDLNSFLSSNHDESGELSCMRRRLTIAVSYPGVYRVGHVRYLRNTQAERKCCFEYPRYCSGINDRSE